MEMKKCPFKNSCFVPANKEKCPRSFKNCEFYKDVSEQK